ncbi:DUF4294 domain-containing protein [Flavobacterium capsici]|uniref:DUF4294 domain-containing protein n=1 Tax=Flavobacterium capsici TaxID=3075618 RepID=A0AA96F339_9FLAO|nr:MULTISPECIES: DUF4294 domain-containing protein [unclassified Flavobacterium]WNM17774.1 DUF4294 domain-containing protein [Flavobacterium sp. PMR2A8]WNM21827.1 DUF4294 domain-containing protein [Flavobacterium sp. PMTSA4]
MKNFVFALFGFFITALSFGQITKEPVKTEIQEVEVDTAFTDTIQLEEVFINRGNFEYIDKKDFQLLQNRVYRVYPYAKVASERLTFLNKNLEKLKTNKEKKKYFKLVENYMENEFTSQLKKLSRKQGQILVKLIHRQTGFTTFDLIKDYKSGWKAFWSQNTARVFNINLKTQYQPFQVNEDFLIEVILDRAFSMGRLVEQKPAFDIDMDALMEHWEKGKK